MHRKNPISVLVYNTLFPTPSPTDPPSFSAHLSKNLVGEVRIETANFYGSLDTIEARYPGLNYAFQPHRKRLGRFPHHKRLFDAFDRLGLTEAEIQGFCRWEGTLWARERYERDEGVRVVDTTGVEIGAWVDNRRQYSRHASTAVGINVKTDIEVEIEELENPSSSSSHHNNHNHNNTHNNHNTTTNASTSTTSSSSSSSSAPPLRPQHPSHSHTLTTTTPNNPDTEMPDSSSDSPSDSESTTTTSSTSSRTHLSSSVGFSLNARLFHAAALREASGSTNIPMDPEWEQYLKEASERGELNIDATREALRSMAGHIAQIHQSGVEAEGSEAVPQTFQAPAAPA
ncbi:hypothetical protein P3342_013276 [Pyrenophora teres f. teres]|uniref:Uncharacterized protein n=2 Tax=Pyrenophora teres f. teres TaxID=97479 RepID=E3S5D6_PYRTT|nr:hypothetical protein PTT_17838 [Pyrenophora teres f. teres 0-1]KAE8823398.1 hypothetical protein HRS9139_09807 [Pyrenophora teres f. teres]CAA9966896.1 hypothetical protein PTMSG1_10255 [Pyrenophora teres f. maculata]KAE8834003.1 hypothetical protein HRS9122_08083 [Pyrenophora teres f. teres]KAE8854573.1 hypothetical protein PTNB29_09929 [Pyrenophora teres f. teres]